MAGLDARLARGGGATVADRLRGSGRDARQGIARGGEPRPGAAGRRARGALRAGARCDARRALAHVRRLRPAHAPPARSPDRVGVAPAAFGRSRCGPARRAARAPARRRAPPGAAAGSSASGLAQHPGSRSGGAAPSPRDGGGPHRGEGGGARAAPAAAGPHLHVVTGGTPSAVMRAALELAARRLALGERVLLVDGSSRLRLHERLGRDARWGLLECLAADMPVLGLVQYAGHPGLYLLPHGNAERTVGWSSLGRKLDEVVPHFARIVLALDPGSPAGIGDALRGRAMEGWWGGTDRRAETAADLATARFGIVFHGLELASLPDPTLELLAERVRALSPAGPAPEPAPITAPAQLRLPPAPRPALEPIVLDCDLQVRERLRLLAWMRRVEAEHRRIEVQAPS